MTLVAQGLNLQSSFTIMYARILTLEQWGVLLTFITSLMEVGNVI